MLKATWRGRALLAAALAGAAALHLASALRTPVGAASDDALHLLLARNVWDGGFAVPDAGGTPVTDPLPGFALLMAPAMRLLSPHWGLLRFAALLGAALLAFAAFRLSRRLSGESAAWAAAAAIALNPTLIGWAGVALPDIPFAAVSAGALLVLARERLSLLPLILLAALAALLRPQGAVLAAALAAGIGFREGPRRAALFLGAALAPLGLWLMRNHLLAGTPTAYVEHWQSLLEAGGPGMIVRSLGVLAGLGRGLFGGLPALPALAASLLALVALLAGGRRLWREGGPGRRGFVLASFLYLTGLLLLHLGWRASWQSRYIIPFLAAAVPLWAAAAHERRWALLLFLLMLAPGAQRAAQHAREGLKAAQTEPWPVTAEWLRSNSAPEDSIVSIEPYLVSLLTGRRAYFPAPAASRQDWLAALRERGSRFVLLRPSAPRAFLSGEARELLESFDAWAVPSPPLKVAFADPHEATIVLRLD